jgi:peptidoglycan/LPS O-acetylase OafA/YrhL
VSDEPAVTPDSDRSLQNLRLGVLATLAGCALVIAASAGTPEPDTAPPTGYGATAIGLAVSSILLRLWGNAPRRSERLELPLIAASLALAGAIGVVAVLVSVAEDQWRTGLFYTLAGAMLAIRTPSTSRPAARDD